MIGDIDQAISMLPDTWPDNQYGRPTKLAALAFKEMALLYDASPLMQNDLNSVQIKSYDQERAKAAAKAAWAAITYMKQNEAKTGVRLATADEYMNLFWFPRYGTQACRDYLVAAEYPVIAIVPRPHVLSGFMLI